MLLSHSQLATLWLVILQADLENLSMFRQHSSITHEGQYGKRGTANNENSIIWTNAITWQVDNQWQL